MSTNHPISESQLEVGWKLWQKNSYRDEFVFDIINFLDLDSSQPFSRIAELINSNSYSPSQLLTVSAPKNKSGDYRTISVFDPIDEIVLYTFMFPIILDLDKKQSNSVRSARLLSGDPENFFSDNSHHWIPAWMDFISIGMREKTELVLKLDIKSYSENIRASQLYNLLSDLVEPANLNVLQSFRKYFDYWNNEGETVHDNTKLLLNGANDIHVFWASIYLHTIDDIILHELDFDENRYFRCLDDIFLFVRSSKEAKHYTDLVNNSLHQLGMQLNLSKSKTGLYSEIVPVEYIAQYKVIAEASHPEPELKDLFALYFADGSLQNVDEWTLIYQKCLEKFTNWEDQTYFDEVLELFFLNPKRQVVSSSFQYLKQFTLVKEYEDRILFELLNHRDGFHPFHLSYIYRLAAFSRGQSNTLFELSYRTLLDNCHWLVQISILFFMNTYVLSPKILREILPQIDMSNVYLQRCMLFLECQKGVLSYSELLNEMKKPSHLKLEDYVSSIVEDVDLGDKLIEITNSCKSSTDIIYKLHLYDLSQHNVYVKRQHRAEVKALVESFPQKWDRLASRILHAIG